MKRLGDVSYRLLLLAFPSSIRAAHGQDMARVFALQRRALAGRPLALAQLWMRAAADALRQGWGARWRASSVTDSGGRRGYDRTSTASWFDDLRFAIRSLVRLPATSAVAILALALGIGANAAIFSVAHVVMISPLPYPDGDRVVLLWRQNATLGSMVLAARLNEVDAWRGSTSLEAIVTYTGASFTVQDPMGDPIAVDGARIEPAVIAFTGTRPLLGRPFTAADAARAGDPAVVLLSEEFWRTRFHGDPDVVGHALTVNESRLEVVGVLPRQFRLPSGRPQIVVPLTPPGLGPDGTPRVIPVSTMGRLARGVTPEMATAELSARMLTSGSTRWSARVMTPTDLSGLPLRRAVLVLAGAVACVLLIACANVAHLLLARNAARRRELAVRAALGATRWRLIRLLLIEQLALAVVAGALGVVVAAASLSAVGTLRPPDMRALEYAEIGPATLLFLAMLSVATAALIGWVPSWSAARRATSGRRAEPSRIIGDARGRWVRLGLSTAEIALALVLLAGAGMLLRTYQHVMTADPGYTRANLVTLSLELPASRYQRPAAQRDFFDRLAAALQAIPSIRRHAFAASVPPDGGLNIGQIEIEGQPMPDAPVRYEGGGVQPGYFEILQVPIVEGRSFTAADIAAGAPAVAIVGQTAARQFWPGEPAIGKRIRLHAREPWRTIVGVAADIKSDIGSVQMYEPLVAMSRYQSAVIETDGAREAVLMAIRGQLRALDPRLPIARLEMLDDAYARVNVRQRFNALLVSLLAAIGLVLAASGVYGVINYSVSIRMPELGVRVALGATPAALASAVLREACAVALVGIALGLGIWIWVGGLMAALLVDLTPTDGLTLSAVAGLLLATTLLAAWVPSRRACRADPVDALRRLT